MRVALPLLAVALLGRAASADDIDRRLSSYEAEARTLAADIPRPSQITAAGGSRKLVDAEVAFSTGD